MNQPRPLGVRKTVQLLVILTLLAWATQTLFKQWGFGAIILPEQMRVQQTSVKLELRADASVEGMNVTLRQVCRWSQQDEAAMSRWGDVVLTHLTDAQPAAEMRIDEVQSALRAAGANLSQMQFTGAASCAIRRNAVEVQPAVLLKQADRIETQTEAPTTQPSAPPVETIAQDVAQTPLRDLLVADFCQRVQLPAEQVQITFDPRYEPTLILTAPRCRFQIDPRQAATLGRVIWDVTIATDTTQRRAVITGTAMAYEDQLVLTRPLSKGQMVTAGDLTPRRALVDKLDDERVTDPIQLVGQQMAHPMKRGDTILAGDVQPVPIIRKGQFVTVAIQRGNLKIETVARALDPGARGQVIRVQNEANGEVYAMTVTGAGEGEMCQPKPSVFADVAVTGQQSAIEH